MGSKFKHVIYFRFISGGLGAQSKVFFCFLIMISIFALKIFETISISFFSFGLLQGVWGFITGGLTWFAIPFSLATTMGLAYLGMSSAQGAPLLSEKDVSAGKIHTTNKS